MAISKEALPSLARVHLDLRAMSDDKVARLDQFIGRRSAESVAPASRSISIVSMMSSTS